MRSHLPRAVLLITSLLPGALLAQSTDTPPTAPAPAVTSVPAGEPQDTEAAKLAVALRSFAVLQAENDQLKETQEKLLAEKASLEAQLAVAKQSIPVAEQANSLREQLRLTQDQLAAVALENNQLKTRLALAAPSPGLVMPPPTHPGTPAAAAAATPVPETPAAAPRTHVIAPGDTLGKISRQYYGTSARWADILAANRDVLRDEKSLVVGKVLKIP
ncbi:MAG: LysM peptidoglycan-binding domain-containing protein [Verrucomicrobia bacterium]|nr:LysM peptidoglycan-binding domain-containing protein [Verrucomicrobiota bacterium]